MIVDSSALVAVAFGEPGSKRLAQVMATATDLRMSAAAWAESGIVLDSKSIVAGQELDRMLAEFGITIVALTADVARVARSAHHRFGRGSGSRARLNFGDCFSYALAITTGEPLLFAGEDFTHTDVLSAL